jgi:membrane associated rhomboid family serine protease
MTNKFQIGYYAPEAVKSYFHEFQYYAGQLSNNPSDAVALRKTVEFMEYYKNYFLGISNMVGASGAVFGVLLAFGMLFPNQLIYFYFFIPIKAKYFVMLYGLFELYNGLSNDAGDNVAHFAHLGGMLFGYVLIKYWTKQDRQNFY